MDVSINRSLLRGCRKLVEAKRRLFNVALGSNAMPPVVVQRDASLDVNLQRAVTNVKGEEDLSGGCVREGRKSRLTEIIQQSPFLAPIHLVFCISLQPIFHLFHLLTGNVSQKNKNKII